MAKTEFMDWSIHDMTTYLVSRIGQKAFNRLTNKRHDEFISRFYTPFITPLIDSNKIRFRPNTNLYRRKLLMMMHVVREIQPLQVEIACKITGQAPGNKQVIALLATMPKR